MHTFSRNGFLPRFLQNAAKSFAFLIAMILSFFLGGFYDICTMGAYTAFGRKSRSGGLWKLIQQLQEQYTPEGTLSKVTKVKRACDLLNTLYHLQGDIQKYCDDVCHEALQGEGASLQKATDRLAEKVCLKKLDLIIVTFGVSN